MSDDLRFDASTFILVFSLFVVLGGVLSIFEECEYLVGR